MDRLFYSASFSKQMKVGAAVVSCRRGGNMGNSCAYSPIVWEPNGGAIDI